MKLETRVEFKKFKFTAEVTTSFNHQSASVAQPPESEKQATKITELRSSIPLKTRSGRVIKKPITFKDYIS